MRGPLRPAGLLVLSALLALVFGASAAQADTGDIIAPQNDPPTAEDGFQAGTCISDGAYPIQCSPDTPELFYTQAGGHPPIGFTQYIVKHTTESSPFGTLVFPSASPKTIRVDLPPGLTVNPQATPQCERVVFVADETKCPPGSIIGREEVTVAVGAPNAIPNPSPPPTFLPVGFVIPPMPGGLLNTLVDIYNIEPEFGEPARFGFKIGPDKNPVYLEGDVDWSGDYHQGFTIKLPPPNPAIKTVKSRLVNFGRSGDGTYITNPTTCFDPDTGAYSTFLRARGHDPAEQDEPFPEAFTPWEAGLPPGVEQTGCELVPFDPTLDVKPGTHLVDSPAAPEVTVRLPFNPDPEGLEQSHVRNSSINLPEGMGLNPSAANVVAVCTDEQFGKGTRRQVTCPHASRIGTAAVETQPLPAGSLTGYVYLGQQLGFNPQSGHMYRIFINPVSERYGVDVRLIGNIQANPTTGRLTATLANTPQVPFESVTLKLDPTKGVLTSPPTCGPNQTTSSMEPWARPGTTENPSSTFTLTNSPLGGPCPKTLAERPFNPAFEAGPAQPGAGEYSPFHMLIQRPDGAQEIRRINVKLPPGMVARLRGVGYCPEAAIDAAGAKPGTAETAASTCPDNSFIGVVGINAGSGTKPIHVGGNVYLAGPYKGAPISFVFVTPAVAGPFDLGNVVVRAAIHVDPETAEVHAVSDPIPDVFGGAKLGIRAIHVGINRSRFTVNPTTCRETFPVRADIFGGGADPTNPAAWVASPQQNPFQATNCKALRFKPKFHARILGGKNQTRRAKNPKFRAVLAAREGDANIRRAAFILPRATILDQSHIRTICTRVQLAASKCPKAAIYGHARATSPLLGKPLKGPVYLTSSSNELPDLLADLRGQVNIRLRGVISSKGARLKTVFRKVPDVPVSKFVLTMRGGNRGLLVNSQNLCDRPRSGILNLLAQNSRRMKTKNLRLNIPACRGGKKG